MGTGMNVEIFFFIKFGKAINELLGKQGQEFFFWILVWPCYYL